MHLASFDKWPHSPLGWALIGCASSLVLMPMRTPLLALTALLEFLFIQQGMPETANHLMFEGFVCFTWLFSLAMQAGAARRRGVPWRKVLDGDANGRHPLQGTLLPLSAAFLLLYWLSVLHKLNYDFIDPDVSCASYMYRRVSELLPFMPRARWAEHLSIWGTLLAEASVPALLLHRRTWRFGLVAALGLPFAARLRSRPPASIASRGSCMRSSSALARNLRRPAGQQLERLQARAGARPPLLYLRIARLAASGASIWSTARRATIAGRSAPASPSIWSGPCSWPQRYLITLFHTPRCKRRRQVRTSGLALDLAAAWCW
jgi:hypothetical protein